ncbi:hypothetical protein NEOLEDRAFT_881230 [Neolentinus lepideus HHB14362 ss-1]|uniref:dual-specificity kinase n=1 Tax=Neolentinus lepideus HHB14362 ss-1 TaxID=1314782 RepID=A0A165NXR5_9AGAM|nr:hypothetical protein NEOLEDRAFT_881230 [Neolentinus lepideus HHB14362 ss-1]
MSAPPSPHTAQVASSKGQSKRRDRPPALELTDVKAASDGDVRYERAGAVDTRKSQQQVCFSRQSPTSRASTRSTQPRFYVSAVNENGTMSEPEQPRSASATSSLDPYYFGMHTPAESPAIPVPDLPFLSKTPESLPQVPTEPVTPVRNPAAIDRKGLIGVGDLATPRWTRPGRVPSEELLESPELPGHHEEHYSIINGEGPEDDDGPGSPWTIEAIDGELDDQAELEDIKFVPRAIRPRRSMAEESGGEEILYPRNPLASDNTPRASDKGAENNVNSEPFPEETAATAPPSAFQPNPPRAKKRSSDEFEKDQHGDVFAKNARASLSLQAKDKSKEVSVRRHKSLGVGLPPSSPREREKSTRERRRESVSISLANTPKASAANRESVSSKSTKHTRHTSAGSPSSNLTESHHSRRAHTTDFSHLPPSPSSSSIQQFIKRTSSKDLSVHSSPNVAHSLLRGTQEGWSGLDDEATAEALRKLDGLSGKSARARSSVSVGRPGSSSRPGTPGAAKNTTQWEGISSSESAKSAKRNSARDSVGLRDKEKDRLSGAHRHALSPAHGSGEAATDAGEASGSHEEKFASSASDKLAKRSSVRSTLNFTTPKRTSASSTTYASTPTTSSRDSASLSATTSITSVSASSGRYSSSKLKRNSASSDVSSIHSGDVIASNGEAGEEEHVPPVPPLPKDLNQFKTPPLSSQSASFPPVAGIDVKPECDDFVLADIQDNQTDSLEIPQATAIPMKPPPVIRQDSLNSQAGYTSSDSVPAQKTPSKKWSFSHALNIRLSGSPSSPSVHSPAKTPAFSVSPRSATFGSQLRHSSSKDQPLSPSKGSAEAWSPIQPDAMASASSLASLSSVGSVRMANSPSSSVPPMLGSGMRGPGTPSRPGTPSSGGTNQTIAVPQNAPLSPSSSIRRGTSSKRLTPSSIPFFRRSSSQSMHIPNQPDLPSSISPTFPSDVPTSAALSRKNSGSPNATTKDALLSPTTPHKKSSIMSLGSLLKGSSSRKSLQDKSDPKSGKESARASDKEKSKKDDKDRSESRISVLMGRKRGKTLSSTDPKKTKPVAMPPMQISALPASTAQRVANLKASSSSSSSSAGPSRNSRATSQTLSSMQKQSDASLRSSRNQLPTIAGSPSVGTVSSQTKELPPSSLMNSVSGVPKETPTKIPRIASRSSTAASPSLKNGTSTVASRRTSIHASGLGTNSADPSPVPDGSMNEFGVMDNASEYDLSKSSSQILAPRASIRSSPSRVPRHASTTSNVGTAPSSSRKPNRESISFSGLRKASTASVASVSSVAPSENNHHRFSALSPSKGLKLLSPKMSLPGARSNNSSAVQNIHQAMASPSSSRLSLSTPSPVPSSVDDEELAGDEEMISYIKRQQAKKLAAGASQEELDDLLRFPEPIRPTTPLSSTSFLALLRSSQAQWLSEYERKEVLDYPSVYFFGARSEKKPATPSNAINNYGYDDERGDYLVINGDHLGYRYEVVDTLGKGSFGQVLRCRDHCTGECVAIKIIRNKKRFHHQALVEIKILDNLRKWDHDEKHHVIKMTEHFYFRNHLCIAMELLSINLYELIKANGFVGFTTALIRRFTSQMLLSLSLMRSHRVVHCDLKPENVLLKHPAKSAIKVIDFGSSCFEHEKIYTYIQSRFYRSPEVILGMNYHMAIDMWSLGCILAELYTGFPIFPGENEQEQLSCIMEVLGVPDKDFVNRSSRKRIFFDSTGAPRPVVNSKGRRRRPGTKTLAQVLRCDDELFVDFIAKCLVWDPEKRMKPQAASRHPFVTSGKRPRITNPTPGTAKALLASATNLSSSRSKPTDTPKKSQISAPTPLTARVSRTNPTGVPNTPSSSSSHATTLGSSTRGYRASQSQTFSSYHSSRTNGFATTK